MTFQAFSSRQDANVPPFLWCIKLPRFPVPHGESHEFESDARFHFHVEVLHPLADLVVRYRGWLAPSQPRP